MMGDETVEPAADTSGSSADPAAIAIALGATGALGPRAAAYLDKQGALADLQIARMIAQDAHIREEQRLQLSHLRIRRFSDYSKMALEIAAGLFLLAIVCGFGVMVWNAAHDHSLVIEAFAVPPDMATRGVGRFRGRRCTDCEDAARLRSVRACAWNDCDTQARLEHGRTLLCARRKSLTFDPVRRHGLELDAAPEG